MAGPGWGRGLQLRGRVPLGPLRSCGRGITDRGVGTGKASPGPGTGVHPEPGWLLIGPDRYQQNPREQVPVFFSFLVETSMRTPSPVLLFFPLNFSTGLFQVKLSIKSTVPAFVGYAISVVILKWEQ